ncbi:Pkinase-domain-containing protein [Auriscalpium vulgare]|uniref:Pkinase-domain-containing protein n=1 Tax=Auriscalpium vulgare TaxID=40419 RepID=A0ACB8SAQ6_9AGAM|nr:Pkinase-domain-containing protein [Auriscalpium vulgare]
MIKLWPSLVDQLTPKASAGHERNPFDALPPSPSPSVQTHHHHLLSTAASAAPLAPAHDLTPLAPLSPSMATIASAALPTTHLSLHAPDFNMQLPPPKRPSANTSSADTPRAQQTRSTSTVRSHGSGAASGSSKGQIHVKLISARGLNVASLHSRPYIVVVFENNEFVSRDPTDEGDKEVKGVATNLSRTSSSVAINALGAIGSKAAAQGAVLRARGASISSTNSGSTQSSLSKASGSQTPSNGLLGRRSAHNPVWKHEVSFDVTSEESTIAFNIYDRSQEVHGFLGSVQFKPVLIHDHTVDQWYKLRPYENEPNITGEIRIQITFEQYKSKRSLTPRDFEFLKLIGRGTFGRVFQVRKRDTKRIYAMKVLSKKEIIAKKEVAHTIGERKILQRSLESPFLVGLKFSFQTDTDLYLVTDFKSGGELFWHLQKETRFSEERARFYIAELVLALEHLHKYDIVYRDLKPENILLDATGHVALCDFGLSKPDLRSDELTNTFCGTTEYLAPEVLLDEHGYSKLVDFWSLGVLLFEMCCGWSPFYAEDTQQMYKNICFGKIRFPRGVINEDGKQFVKGLLNRNPKHRLGAQRDAEELKEHPYFKTIDWDALARKQVTPPFKPVVESDESTANFDPEFTSADVADAAGFEIDLDDNDPSGDWTSQSVTNGSMYHGPLGSDRPLSRSPTQGISIKPKRRGRDPAGSPPLTNSVQENFRGFTYSGEAESLIARAVGRLGEHSSEEEAVDDEDDQEPTTEDEAEDDAHPAGRYSRRKGYLDDFDEDMHA